MEIDKIEALLQSYYCWVAFRLDRACKRTFFFFFSTKIFVLILPWNHLQLPNTLKISIPTHFPTGSVIPAPRQKHLCNTLQVFYAEQLKQYVTSGHSSLFIYYDLCTRNINNSYFSKSTPSFKSHLTTSLRPTPQAPKPLSTISPGLQTTLSLIHLPFVFLIHF